MFVVEDLDSWPAEMSEAFRIDHYCGQELQESGAIWVVKKARSRLLSGSSTFQMELRRSGSGAPSR